MYDKITLPNGVRILTEQVPGVRSASLGIWVGTGSRHEKAAESGSAHFIEHMVFKGTERRSAAQLAEEMDAIGGQINAFTTKECTCFYGRVLDTHLPRCTDLLCDMLFHSRFDEADVRTERGVILEEIGMYEDNPEDLSAERLAAAVFQGSALARPILGRPATLERMTGETLRDYMRSHYRPGDLVVALAGSFQPQDVEELKARFSALEAGGACPDEGRHVPARLHREEKAPGAEPSDAGLSGAPLWGRTAVCPPAPFLHLGERHVLPAVAGGAGKAGAVLLDLLLRRGAH